MFALGRFHCTKLGVNVSYKNLVNVAKFQVKTFTVLELLKENQQGGGGENTPTEVRDNRISHKGFRNTRGLVKAGCYENVDTFG